MITVGYCRGQVVVMVFRIEDPCMLIDFIIRNIEETKGVIVSFLCEHGFAVYRGRVNWKLREVIVRERFEFIIIVSPIKVIWNVRISRIIRIPRENNTKILHGWS